MQFPSSDELIALLRQNILFVETTPDLLTTIAESLMFLPVKQGNQIFHQGEEASGLYLIAEGSIQIVIEHDNEYIVLSHAGKGHLCGEFLLSGNSVRSNSAQALSDSLLLFWPIDAFSRLLSQQGDALLSITSRLVRRLSWNQIMSALRLSHFFTGLNEQIARELINQLTIKSVPANALLLKQHDEANDMYIVINGQFQVSKTNGNNQQKTVALIGRGETLGEMGLICATPRSADARALRDSTVACLTRATFEDLLRRYPLETNQTFVKSVIHHIETDTFTKSAPAQTFALINLSPRLDVQAFLQSLLVGLQRHGLAQVLSSAGVDRAFMCTDAAQCDFTAPNNDGLVQWLSEQELAHQHIVYYADDQLSHWTRRCLRQADHVLFLVDGKDSSAISAFESQVLEEIGDCSLKKSLIIQHSHNTSTPIATSAWLTPRQLDGHYHVRQDRQTDFDRLARFMTGNALGLVLGGGAARGFAHIGVLKALRELNIAVDLVGGNSMGAVLAAEYALQWDEQQMLEKTQQLCIQGDHMTLPLVSLFSGKTMTAALKTLFGDLCIEDLWIPFFCVSCNISRAKLMTHRQGTLLSALLSSNAPPGLFPPQVRNGDLLVDGALLNNLPVDVMREFNQGGSVIAVDVNEREDLLNNTDNLGGISGWQLLWSRINPLTPRIQIPSMVQILTRSSMIGGLAQQKKMHEGLADLYLRPPVINFPLTGYNQAKAITEAGYRYAQTELERWLESQNTGPSL